MEYNQQAQQWLDTPAEERDLETGARLMLQARTDKILGQQQPKRHRTDRYQISGKSGRN